MMHCYRCRKQIQRVHTQHFYTMRTLKVYHLTNFPAYNIMLSYGCHIVQQSP